MKSLFLVMACLTLLTSGCGPRLADRRDVSLKMGEIASIPIDAVSQEQTIKITASSPGAPINVHVFLKDHEEAIERDITLAKSSENLLAHQSDATQISLEALIPTNKEVVVRLETSGPHSANVQLEITN